MNQTEEYTYLVFDKAIENDHSYTNKLTSSITVSKMFLSNYECIEGLDAIEEFNKFKELDNIDPNLDQSLYKAYLFSYSLNGAKVKITIFAVNNKMLENYVINSTQIPNLKFLISLCNSHILYEKVSNGFNLYSTNTTTQIDEIVNSIIKIVSVPNASIADPIEGQPEYCALPLYEYQKKTIKWMIQREEYPTMIDCNQNDELMLGNVVYDSGEQNFILSANRKQLKFMGGGLIDEMGLGKTYQLMVLALQRLPRNINYVQRGLRMLFSRATLILTANHLSAQWYNELHKLTKKSFGINVIKIFTKVDYEKYTYSDILDADFVIVTFQFLANKCFQNQFRSKISDTKSYFTSSKSTYTYLETQMALDEMAFNILNNPSALFHTSPNVLLCHWHRIVIDEFPEIYTVEKHAHMKKLITHLKGDYRWCMSGTPFNGTTRSLMSMFEFVTNYTNEIGDQILLNQRVRNYLSTNFFRKNTKQSVNSEYTLPPTIENTIFLTFSTTEWIMYNAYLANPNVDKSGVLMRQLCCHPAIADEIKGTVSNCKTLKDIENVMIKHYNSQTLHAENKLKFAEYKLKMLQYKIKIVHYKRQARFLRKLDYNVTVDFGIDVTNKEEMKQLEKHFSGDDDFIAFLLTNDNIEAIDDDIDTNKKINNKNPSIVVSDETQCEIQKLLAKEKDYKHLPKSILDLQDSEINMKTHIANLRKDYEGKLSTSNYYNDVLKRLAQTSTIVNDNDDDNDDNNKEECGICLGTIKGTDLGVTKCGHIFCYKCVKPYIEKTPKCPICTKPIKIEELYMITQPVQEELNNKEFKDKQSLIEAIGTKLANLIFFLKKNNKHCIIFSQWDDLLMKVGGVLNSYGIFNVFCKGNVWQCTKAVNDFNTNDNIKVIMLSSKSSASGINLTKAEMVILLDPVSGSYEDRKNTEWQAIGRAVRMGQTKQVQIVRFIIKNTIEETIYQENLIENAKHVENIIIFELNEEVTNIDQDLIDEINNNAKISKPKKVTKRGNKKVPEKIIVDIEDDGDY